MFGILIDLLVCNKKLLLQKKPTLTCVNNQQISNSIVYLQEEYELINRAVYDYIQNTSESIYSNQ